MPRTFNREKQRKKTIAVYNSIISYRLEHDNNPTIREIADLLDTYFSGIPRVFHRLERAGLIRLDEHGRIEAIIGSKWIPPPEPNWEELL